MLLRARQSCYNDLAHAMNRAALNQRCKAPLSVLHATIASGMTLPGLEVGYIGKGFMSTDNGESPQGLKDTVKALIGAVLGALLIYYLFLI